jgi:serine/threonine protein kinase
MLSSLRHPYGLCILHDYLYNRNIVLFIGVSVSENYKFIITELMAGQSLDHILFKSKQQRYDRHSALPFVKKLSILIDVCKAMMYLHSQEPKIIHRDLKLQNILLDGQDCSTAKVADFGTSKLLRSGTQHHTANIGTVQFMSPEVIAGEEYDEKVDIYSFAICMYEVSTLVVPTILYRCSLNLLHFLILNKMGF